MSGGAGTRLTTWPEVHAHLAATYGGQAIEPGDAATLTVSSPRTATEPATSVVIEVRPLDGAWLKLTCVIGSLHHQSPAAQLAHNARAVIGVACTRDGELAIKQTLPLAGLLTADLDETLRTIAQLAAERTRELG